MGRRINTRKTNDEVKRPRLKRSDTGGYINKHGIEISDAEKRRLESLVNSINRKRRKQLEFERSTKEGEGLQNIGHESDIILAKRSKSVHQFRSREAFENRIRTLERVNEKSYIDARVELYRKNYLTALDNAFGNEANDIKLMIRTMSAKQYMEKVQGNEDLEFGYIYGPDDIQVKLNQIRKALGLPAKELPHNN